MNRNVLLFLVFLVEKMVEVYDVCGENEKKGGRKKVCARAWARDFVVGEESGWCGLVEGRRIVVEVCVSPGRREAGHLPTDSRVKEW